MWLLFHVSPHCLKHHYVVLGYKLIISKQLVISMYMYLYRNTHTLPPPREVILFISIIENANNTVNIWVHGFNQGTKNLNL